MAMRSTTAVILTKVRIQSYLGQRWWLWVLTFVRMTRGLYQMAQRRIAAITASGFSQGTKCPASTFSIVSSGT